MKFILIFSLLFSVSGFAQKKKFKVKVDGLSQQCVFKNIQKEYPGIKCHFIKDTLGVSITLVRLYVKKYKCVEESGESFRLEIVQKAVDANVSTIQDERANYNFPHTSDKPVKVKFTPASKGFASFESCQ